MGGSVLVAVLRPERSAPLAPLLLAARSSLGLRGSDRPATGISLIGRRDLGSLHPKVDECVPRSQDVNLRIVCQLVAARTSLGLRGSDRPGTGISLFEPSDLVNSGSFAPQS